MKFINRKFLEFKSIFLTENILEENERHANVVIAATMFNLFIVILLGWILNQLNISNAENINMTYSVLNGLISLMIPAIICFCLKGKGAWLKYLLLGMFIVMLVSIEQRMSYATAFLMTIPVILSARYYKREFTILTSIVTLSFFLIFSFISGVDYITNYQTIISALLLYYVIVFASVQISQSGKNMIEKQKEITEKGTRIETELNLANAIQKSMLPSIFPPFPERDEIDLYALMIPAKEVGGDFYDMFLIDDNHLAICVADVSGKGVPASLVMMVTKILIKNTTKIEANLDNAFKRINNMLCDGNNTGIFITSWFGILDLRNGKIEFINAGHNPPLLYTKKTNEFTYLETKPNFVLAGKENINYIKQEIQIEPGDRLFLYTDGVVEATNIKNELYGDVRLKEYLDQNISLSAKNTILGVKKDVDDFVKEAKQFDDITMLELIYKHKKNNDVAKCKFQANKKMLPTVQTFVEEELKKHNCDEKTLNEIKLAIEEIFINIASYAYKEEEGTCTIKIQEDSPNKFIITFEDNGMKFNPLEVEEPDTSLSSKDRKIGGLGIFLAKKIMDNVEYKYEGNKNILMITKNM